MEIQLRFEGLALHVQVGQGGWGWDCGCTIQGNNSAVALNCCSSMEHVWAACCPEASQPSYANRAVSPSRTPPTTCHNLPPAHPLYPLFLQAPLPALVVHESPLVLKVCHPGCGAQSTIRALNFVTGEGPAVPASARRPAVMAPHMAPSSFEPVAPAGERGPSAAAGGWLPVPGGV